MSEKRFTVEGWVILNDGESSRMIEVNDLIESFVEENEQLKSEYKVLHTQYKDLKKFVENNFDEHLTQKELNRQIIKLSNENEQLKQQIKDLRLNVLDNIHKAGEAQCCCNPCVVEEYVKKMIK